MLDHCGYSNQVTLIASIWLANSREATTLREMIEQLLLEHNSATYIADEVKTYLVDTNPLASEDSLYSNIISNLLADIDYLQLVIDVQQDLDS